MIFKIILIFRRIYWKFILPILVRKKGIKLGDSVRFYGAPIIEIKYGSNIIIGSECKFCSVSEMTALGVGHPVILRTLAQGAIIKIDQNTGLSGVTICAASSVKIGKDCLIGSNSVITDTDFHPVDKFSHRVLNTDYGGDIGVQPIEIMDNVFIGANVIILKGVTIGRNSVIGAGSIVSSDVPCNSVYGGNPASFIREINAP